MSALSTKTDMLCEDLLSEDLLREDLDEKSKVSYVYRIMKFSVAVFISLYLYVCY